ncbi:MAG: T9SS type A sorting domain-containing protein [Bacteroidota bacterium]
MRYSLIVVFILFLSFQSAGQIFISGPTLVCEDDETEYSVYPGACAYWVEVLEWVVVGGTIIATEDHSIIVHWDNPEAGTGTVDVNYKCWPNPFEEDASEDWAFTKDVEYRHIQKPLFLTESIDLMMGESIPFTITTPNQGTGMKYSWTFPECIPGTDGSNSTYVTPDLVSSGTICLEVTNAYCGVKHKECIDVTRSCVDTKTYSESDPDEIPEYTSVNLDINTSGEVEPTYPSVEFKAGESINLNPGFSANAEFFAHIAPCGGPFGGECIGLGSMGMVAYELFEPKIEDSTSKTIAEPSIQSVEILNEFQIDIFPNPAGDYFNISLRDFDSERIYMYEIFSMQGQRLESGSLSGQQTSINCSNLTKGQYLIRVNTQSEISVLRLIKY